ncbi:MAG: Lar family restriction alleviation protein [Gammaproteobacteria bacterium]|nr:Lar family restriction alleviation protein [Gammaproteobacteria bacterium]
MELKPCPHSHPDDDKPKAPPALSWAPTDEHTRQIDGVEYQCWIECGYCGAQGPVCDGKDNPLAAELWNTRQPVSSESKYAPCWHGVPLEDDCKACADFVAEIGLQKSEEYCHANQHHECTWDKCPQLRDGEPQKSHWERNCPLYLEDRRKQLRNSNKCTPSSELVEAVKNYIRCYVLVGDDRQPAFDEETINKAFNAMREALKHKEWINDKWIGKWKCQLCGEFLSEPKRYGRWVHPDNECRLSGGWSWTELHSVNEMIFVPNPPTEG